MIIIYLLNCCESETLEIILLNEIIEIKLSISNDWLIIEQIKTINWSSNRNLITWITHSTNNETNSLGLKIELRKIFSGWEFFVKFVKIQFFIEFFYLGSNSFPKSSKHFSIENWNFPEFSLKYLLNLWYIVCVNTNNDCFDNKG